VSPAAGLAAGGETAAQPGATRVAGVTDRAPEGWDRLAVDVPGGHVMQSVAWAEHRRRQGAEPRFVSFGDGHVALVTLRRSPAMPGASAACRRGPALAGDAPEVHAGRCAALAAWARDEGARDLFLDPVIDATPAWDVAMEAAGFVIADELEPSIHVMRLDLPTDGGEEAAWAGFSRSTRQRIGAAERAGTTVRRDDDAGRLDEFGELLLERAEALGIPLREGRAYLGLWRAEIDSGIARLLVAEHGGELVGGLLLYLQGGVHATAYSADRAARRRELPGTMHLVRWTAIREAVAAGVPAIELGGVDLPGRREPPRTGDPNYGLFEHKASFGAHWVVRTPARRIVLRPWLERYAALRRGGLAAVKGVARRARR
jgi:lipid II:glycine glycyltransferase (peptidoglycan interpeptide bridge formation enzyme)